MAVLLITRKENQSYTHLIEEGAHLYLPVRQVRFKYYFYAEEFCKKYGISTENLFKYMQKSNNLHGVLCANGVFLLHPDGFVNLFKKWAYDLIYKEKDVSTLPITEKEISLD